MIHGKSSFLLAFFLFLAGCNRVTSDCRVIPEKFPDYLPEYPQKIQPIDCDSLYEISFDQDGRAKGMIRFWKNGKAILRRIWTNRPLTEMLNMSSQVHDLTALDGDDFTGGWVGEYEVIGKRLYIEFYHPVTNGWRFITYEGTLISHDSFVINGLITHIPLFFWDVKRPETVHFLAEKKQVGKMIRDPDW